MTIEIKELRKEDYSYAIEFAIQGMNFDQYISNKSLLYMYGKYFLYLELERSSQIIAAYMDDKLVGLLLADMNKASKIKLNFWQKSYLKIVNLVVKTFFKDATTPYDSINRDMLEKYKQKMTPEGEICFLAADPSIKGQGIGTKLLDELKTREKGKEIYLFTDSNCTYQFYDHRNFIRSEEREIQIKIDKKEIPITCFLYSKKL